MHFRTMEYHSLSCKFTGFDNLTKIRVPFFSKTPSELSCFSCYQAMFPFVILRYRSLHIRDSELDSIERFKKEQTNIFQSYLAIFGFKEMETDIFALVWIKYGSSISTTPNSPTDHVLWSGLKNGSFLNSAEKCGDFPAKYFHKE